MNRWLKSKYFKILIFLLVLAFTFILRAHNYEKVPTPNHLDEMLYAWSGIYLVETGVPVSWSTLDYPERAKVYSGRISYKGGLPETYATLYRPWLDEPPLFSLIVGYSAHLFKADRNDFIPSSYIRIPAILFATLTSLMIFFIARLVSSYWMGILSMLIFGTVPVFVFASRSAMPENLIALIFTIMVYLLLKFQTNQKFSLLLPIPILIGVAGLSKPTGYFLLPFAIFLTILPIFKDKITKKLVSYILYLILATVPFIGLYFLYGLYFDPEIFWKIASIQSFRPVGFGSLAWWFLSPSSDTTILRDSWYIFCLLSAFYFIFKPKEGLKRLISFSFVYWVIIVMISGGENDLLAWYRFAAFPMLAILGAWGLEVLVKRSDFFTTFISAGMLLGNRMLLVNAFRPNIMPLNYRVIFSALMLPSLLRILNDNRFIKKVCRMITVGIIIVGMYFNSIYIYNAYEIACENKTCPFVPVTKLSTIHFPIIWRFFVLGEPTYR